MCIKTLYGLARHPIFMSLPSITSASPAPSQKNGDFTDCRPCSFLRRLTAFSTMALLEILEDGEGQVPKHLHGFYFHTFVGAVHASHGGAIGDHVHTGILLAY